MIGPSISIATWNHSEALGMLLDRLPNVVSKSIAKRKNSRVPPVMGKSDLRLKRPGEPPNTFLMLFPHTGHVKCQISTTSWDMTFPQPIPHRILKQVAVVVSECLWGFIFHHSLSPRIFGIKIIWPQLAKLQKSHFPARQFLVLGNSFMQA